MAATDFDPPPARIREYWRRPEANAAECRNGWLRTGDIGFLDGEVGAILRLHQSQWLVEEAVMEFARSQLAACQVPTRIFFY